VPADRKHAQVLSVVLIAQAVLFYTLSRGEAVPLSRPLLEFPSQLGNWSMAQQGVLEKEVLDVLRADDTLSRLYRPSGGGAAASLFVAYFKTQRTGQAPHSPKNCLPGSGWAPSESGVVRIALPGEAEPIEVNHYIVSRGEARSVVLYWYQSRGRVIASEYRAKIHLVLDSIRYHRSDTALVRVVAPVFKGDDAAASRTAEDFVRALFQPLKEFLPN